MKLQIPNLPQRAESSAPVFAGDFNPAVVFAFTVQNFPSACVCVSKRAEK